MRLSRFPRWRPPRVSPPRPTPSGPRPPLGTPTTGTGLWQVRIHGELLNAKNAHAWVWQKRWKWAKDWRDRTSMQILLRTYAGTLPALGPAATPKRVHFLAFVGRHMDDDGLRVAVSPVRDGLQDAWIIHSDGWTSGHEFVYDQEIRPKAQRGVQITVTLR